jgi:hypothetical protein
LAKLTIVFGVLVAAISLGFWIESSHDAHTLHPAGIGVLLILCGVLANTENAKRRMLWMHIAVTAGLVGFLFTGIRAVISLVKGTIAENSLGFDERVIISGLCLIYVALCVRSFIAARRTRVI